MINFPIPVLGFAAWSGTGKTTLLCQLIPLLKDKGVRVGLVKHAHHHFDIDYPGKDSYELRQSGAEEVVIASKHRIALMLETPTNKTEPSLQEALDVVQVGQLDMILVEGFKHAEIPKIELHRSAVNKPYFYPKDANVIALAEDAGNDGVDVPNDLALLDLNQVTEIASFVVAWLSEQTLSMQPRQRVVYQEVA